MPIYGGGSLFRVTAGPFYILLKVSTSWIFSLAPSKFTISTVLCEGAGLANPEMELRPIFQKKHGNGEQNFLDIFEGFWKAKSLYELDF